MYITVGSLGLLLLLWYICVTIQLSAQVTKHQMWKNNLATLADLQGESLLLWAFIRMFYRMDKYTLNNSVYKKAESLSVVQ